MQAGRSGRSPRQRQDLRRLFSNGGRNVVGNYPYYEERTKQVVTFERALNRCLRTTARR